MISSASSAAEVLAHSELIHREELTYLSNLAINEPNLPDEYPFGELFRKLRIHGPSYWSSSRETDPRPSLKLLNELYRGIGWREPSYELLQFVEAHLLPLAGLRCDVPAGVANRYLNSGPVDMCEESEPNFHNTLRQVETGIWHGQRNISVYHDKAGIPLLLRKTYNGSTALTLQPIFIGSLTIPSGTVIKPSRYMSLYQTGEEELNSGTESTLYRCFRAPEPLELVVGRISALAYSNAIDRQLFAVYVHNIGRHFAGEVRDGKLDQLAGMDLEAFRIAASRVMGICGVQL